MARPTLRANPWHLAETQDEGSMWLAWVVRLRWVAIIAQVVTLSFTFMVLDNPVVVVPALLAGAALLVLANLWSVRVLRAGQPVSDATLLGELLVDLTVLTAFFLASGGSANPFVMLYVIHVAMAAVMMRSDYATGVMVFAIVANMLLHSFRLPLHPERHQIPAPVLMSFGQTVAFTVSVVSVGLFIMGMSTTLRRQKQRLIEARERTARTDRLRAVGTLAAGAAHELNTPLSTVGLRLRRITRRHTDEETKKDLDVIRSQLDRCTQIVEQLLQGAGDPSAKGIQVVVLQDLVRATLKMWGKGTPIEHHLVAPEAPIPIEVPPVAFTQALTNLLENAREAQEEVGATDRVDITLRTEGSRAWVEIRDHGKGLPDEPDRVGEPFFTTKPTGTGLGVFVARSVAEGAGGGLRYEGAAPGTLTRWWFPLSERSS